MTRQDLIEKIRIKMDMEVSNTADDYYAGYYNDLIDEALSVVANTVMPYQAKLEVRYGGKYSAHSHDLVESEYYSIDVEGSITLDGVSLNNVNKGDWLYYDSGWKIQKKNRYGYIVKIPRDLMSFSDESAPIYTSEDGDVIWDAPVLYVNSRELALPKDGDYEIWYNSEYPSIKNYESGDLEWLPRNVGTIIPLYVASQLLATEDLTRATIMRNEFETALSRLDDNKPLVARSIKNSSGWTY